MSVDPLTLSMISTVASTGFSVLQDSAASKAEQAQLDYQSKVAQNNADLAENDRQRAIQEGNINAADGDLEASAIIGDMIAEGGASGLDLSTGSKSAAVSSAKRLAARDRARKVQEGAVEGGRFAQQRDGFRNKSSNLLTARANSKSAGRLSVFSSLVSGANKVGGILGESRPPKKKLIQ